MDQRLFAFSASQNNYICVCDFYIVFVQEWHKKAFIELFFLLVCQITHWIFKFRTSLESSGIWM